MKLYDAHTHLNAEPLADDRRRHLQSFVEAGGAGLVNSGSNASYNAAGIMMAKAAVDLFPDCIVRATIGIHPLECVEWNVRESDIPHLMDDLKHFFLTDGQRIVGIGETGLDLHYPNGSETLPLQKKLFQAQCELARDLGLPLVVHSRDAFEETLDVLEDFTDLTIYFHCRGYWKEEIKRLQDSKITRLYIGFCGNITYKNAQNLRDSLALVPADRMLLETDAPRLSPQPVRGQINTPVMVKHIYQSVAGLRWTTLEEIADQHERNFKKIYNIK